MGTRNRSYTELIFTGGRLESRSDCVSTVADLRHITADAMSHIRLLLLEENADFLGRPLGRKVGATQGGALKTQIVHQRGQSRLISSA
jgi:hypothetical protein